MLYGLHSDSPTAKRLAQIPLIEERVPTAEFQTEPQREHYVARDLSAALDQPNPAVLGMREKLGNRRTVTTPMKWCPVVFVPLTA